MDWLNYHHLLYFYLVAREGTISAASELLRLAPSTVSVQIKTLEDSLNVALFERQGRQLVLTPEGQVAYSYAEEIFALGREMLDTFHARPVGRPHRITIGVTDVLWKDIAYQLVQPAARLEHPVRLTLVEGALDKLLADLAVHQVDVVLADAPLGPTVNVKGYNHELGSCGIALFGKPDLIEELRDGFPKSLEGVRMLLPTERTALRRHLDQWFTTAGFRPHIVAEFDDSALMTSFGAAGDGVFPAPSLVAEDILARHDLAMLGSIDQIEQHFYAISVERKIKNPAVQAICNAARQHVFR